MEIIDARDIVHEGHRYTVHVVADTDARPFDADVYSPDDVDAWHAHGWRFVGVLLLDGDGSQLDAVFGVEWGQLPGLEPVGMEEVCSRYPVTVMLAELAMPHMGQYRTAVWSASGDPERPAPHADLGIRTQLAIPATPLMQRWGAWGSCLPQERPDGRIVPTVVVHVAADSHTTTEEEI